MLRRLRENAGWLTLLLTILTSLVGLYVRDALASTDKRLTVVEVQQIQDRKERRLVLQKLDALCRATPNANCPLGTE